ncbi:hypothetical protein EV649_5001 [Kribbella sp. VKM Ac-2569]|uniref:hypothetical protein n=1 Tax=Kribbella sp. VKM Ac-2569 TaxID=2512220 RepID=UPI00102B1711|nr:hypothetical protein [Kribbella sp. VKM Ac-2569]RZT17459.1 hypothetical protein EV649_5001 [Kribbella sp. VKM Ac-2569]
MTDLIRNLLREGRFADAKRYQRVGYVCGALLLLSAGVHAVVFAVDGGSWQGPISWRKPIVFGLSFGITLLTVTWLLTFFRIRNITGWIVVSVLSFASLAEVALVSLQKWRGVESHFNESTTFDSTVFSWMGMLVGVVVVTTVFVTARSFFRIDAPASLAWAIRLGLLLMLASQAVGVQMIAEGGNTFGDSGSLKVPHAFTLHAAQVLPALALLLRSSVSTERRRIRIVQLGAIGYAVVIVSTMIQTYSGSRPLDLGLVSSAVAVAGLGLLGASGLIALRALRSPVLATSRPIDNVESS